MVKFAEKLLRPHQELVEICYFSAKPTDPQKSKRQDAFFQANSVKTLVDRDLYEACLLPETIMLPDGFALRRPDKWR
ncbi:MAG: hypothetical protein LBL94_05290 [Prevotellaceae bacterium]|nr:hypothetical protein [Prevotellaceae bacterium]